MMNRDNLVGFIFLGICGVLVVYLLAAIAEGERLTWRGPGWLANAIVILGFGLVIFGLVRAVMGRRGDNPTHQWPDPQTGKRSLWDRLRGRRRS
jgi:hypothetical protein